MKIQKKEVDLKSTDTSSKYIKLKKGQKVSVIFVDKAKGGDTKVINKSKNSKRLSKDKKYEAERKKHFGLK